MKRVASTGDRTRGGRSSADTGKSASSAARATSSEPASVGITVVTPSYNQGEFIGETIASVLAQGGDDWEHVVVDGGSDDETRSILESFGHLRWVSEPDRGQADALNKGLRLSRGEIIFWINSDDLVAPGAFAEARRHFSEHPECSILCGNAVSIDRHGREISRTGPRVTARKLRRPWDGDTSMHQPSMVFRRKVWEAVGPFDTSLDCAMDYDFFLRASRLFQICQAPVDLGYFRSYGGTKTGEGAARAFQEVRRALVRHVRVTGVGSPTWTAVRGFLAQGCVFVNDAVEAYRDGRPREARRLLLRGAVQNPTSLLTRSHMLYRLRQLLPDAVYTGLRSVSTRGNGAEKRAARGSG